MRGAVLRAICISSVTILLGGAAAAPEAAQTAVSDAWNARLDLVEQRLHENQWETARHLTQTILEELVESSGGTEGDKRANADDLGGAMAASRPSAEVIILGRATGYRAIAEAALDRREEARWHWYMAQNFLKDVSGLELSRYRKPSAILQRYMLVKGSSQYEGLHDVIDPVIIDNLLEPLHELASMLLLELADVALVTHLRPPADTGAGDGRALHLPLIDPEPEREYVDLRGVRVADDERVTGVLVDQPREREELRRRGDRQMVFLERSLQLDRLEEVRLARAREDRDRVRGGADFGREVLLDPLDVLVEAQSLG